MSCLEPGVRGSRADRPTHRKPYATAESPDLAPSSTSRPARDVAVGHEYDAAKL